jgi:hypothetical protein
MDKSAHIGADVHDGRKHKGDKQAPDTDAHDQLRPCRHIRLAAHGRSVQRLPASDIPDAVDLKQDRPKAARNSSRLPSVNVGPGF